MRKRSLVGRNLGPLSFGALSLACAGEGDLSPASISGGASDPRLFAGASEEPSVGLGGAGGSGRSEDVAEIEDCRVIEVEDPTLEMWLRSVATEDALWADLREGSASLSARLLSRQASPSQAVSSLDGLACWGELERLEMADQGISDLHSLVDLKQLESLELSCNPIFDFQPLVVHENLRQLILDDLECDVSQVAFEMSALEGAKGLLELVIRGKPVGQTELLAGFSDLLRLDLEGAAFKHSELRLPPGVKHLSLAATSLAETSALEDLQGIEFLNLRDNELTTLNGLGDLELKEGAEVLLEGNPLQCEQVLLEVELWAEQGVTLRTDCPHV